MSLAGASVALIILIDLVTGQGPPALNAYLGPPPPREYLQQYPMVPQIQPIGYMPRGEYDNRGDYEKPNEVIEKDKGKEKGKGKEKEIEKGKDFEYGKYDKELEKSTPKPGVFASMSNSMSDAWKSLTTLGRQTRKVRDLSGATNSENRSQ